ncbi:4-hydroxythreonine-4-phosphate dehydrogenase [Beggiatoa alba B18LD]|uniref:4-hydroxythreonine-4-phosphate dehydrogenase n=1 Tax=Beggiatoa alba B18LD TaxID=395493 RepID=I3CGK8_9GAMM|nr:4-hydroxythreonine-4-phosphate dehydrogenase PdxA [Beggiatoa alba]EIJ42751.1 4-hydroxythreonine-4-phosphate dehydrogenase [Beggiatoa alba B18LD]
MSSQLPRIALTTGEPAGIGIDISLALAQLSLPAHIVAFTDPQLANERAQQLGMTLRFDVQERHQSSPQQAGVLKIKPLSLAVPCQTGVLDPRNAHYVLTMLQQACQGCMENQFDALVTAPVHKGVINKAGIPFSGHTEFFAEQTGTAEVVMMLRSTHLAVALVTTHLPLTQVSAAITQEKLTNVIQILHKDLQTRFGRKTPHILVCGLNPHAGEGGYLGQEEITTIIPVLEMLRKQGMQLTGPVPADTAFTEQMLQSVDVVLTMYHDQGLPVLKQQSFGDAVNITLGLPIIRTSVDHGTALTLAGTGKAQADSLLSAVKMAIKMINAQY